MERVKATQAEIAGAGFAARPPAIGQATTTTGPMRQFDDLVTDPDLRAACRSLYDGGHYARAVEEAFKFLNNAVKGRSGDPARDGFQLMLNTFSETQPVLRLNRLRTISERDEQKGYGFIFAGAMQGIRNPRAHEHELRDEPDAALEMLVMANHLTRMLGTSVRVRRRRVT